MNEIKTMSLIKTRNDLTIAECLKLKGNDFSENHIFELYYLKFNDNTVCTNAIPLI